MSAEDRSRLIRSLLVAVRPARRLLLLLSAFGLAVAALFSAASVIRLLPDPTSHPFVTGRGVDAIGSAQSLVDASGRASVWSARGSRVTTPELIMRWPERRSIGTFVIRSARSGGLSAVYLRFGDGFRLRAQADREGDVHVEFPQRSTTVLTVVLLHRSPTARISLASLSSEGPGSGIAPVHPNMVAERRFSGLGPRILDWRASAMISSARLQSADPSGSPVPGFLQFSDGSRVRVASTGRPGGLPNVIAFTPRMATSVSYTGEGVAGLESISVYGRGAGVALPRSPRAGYSAVPDSSASPCASATGTSSTLRVSCPTPSTVVGPELTLQVVAAPGTAIAVDAWQKKGAADGAVERVASGSTGPDGSTRLSINTNAMPSGPMSVKVSSPGDTTYLQVVNRVGVSPPTQSPTFTKAMSQQVDERFDRPISISLNGDAAQYAALKPSAKGPTPFGSAEFGDPASLPAPFTTQRGALRIHAVTTTDSNGAIAYRSGLLSSVGSSGGGFSAQYGYFEATVLGAPGPGAWGAFWTQGIGSLLGSGAPFAEADATELYGSQYTKSCSGVLDWMPQPELPAGSCSHPRSMTDWALAYHTYGIEISPDATNAYVDGRLVARFRPAVGAEDPSFFMLNLALGGGYKVDLTGQQGTTSLYATGIRVWT